MPESHQLPLLRSNPGTLHLTIDRIAFDGDITQDRLASIAGDAKEACRNMQPFKVTIGALGGTPGAIGFTVFPAKPIIELRDTMHAATLSSYPNASFKHTDFHPHMAIAYGNSDGIPAAEVIAEVERLSPKASIDVTVNEGTLVLLERRPRAYAWQVVSRIPLSGNPAGQARG
jgi:2'-5' RNA ligase